MTDRNISQKISAAVATVHSTIHNNVSVAGVGFCILAWWNVYSQYTGVELAILLDQLVICVGVYFNGRKTKQRVLVLDLTGLVGEGQLVKGNMLFLQFKFNSQNKLVSFF